MNPSTQKQLDRLLRNLERPRRPGWRFSLAPINLGLGLAMGYVLLTQIVPGLWSELLPGGLEQAQRLRGWPGLVWNLALVCHAYGSELAVLVGGVLVAAFLLGGWSRSIRWLVWLAAVLVVLLDVGILFVTMRTAYQAGAGALGF